MTEYYEPESPEMMAIYVLSIDRHMTIKSVLYQLQPEVQTNKVIAFFPKQPYRNLDLREYSLNVAHELEHDHLFEYHGFVIGPATKTVELLATARKTLDAQRTVLIGNMARHIVNLTQARIFDH